MEILLKPSTVGGCLTAPPSKSIAHRAVLCAALTKGTSRVQGLEYSQDITATLNAAAQLCAKVTRREGYAVIEGLGGFRTVWEPIDCCESGSTLRFLIPLASLTGQDITFTGQGRLFARPMGVYQELFRQKDRYFDQDTDHITIAGALPAGDYVLPGDVSSQFISGLLFLLPLLDKPSRLQILPPFESRSYVELTRRTLADFGIETEWKDENTLLVPGGQTYQPTDCTVEGDYSQAAFAAVLGSLAGSITVDNLRPDSAQGDAVILSLLEQCGAVLHREGTAVRFEKSELNGIEIDLADCPDLGPILMVLGLFCGGTTVIRNAGRLRLKESDRIAAMETELRKLGGEISSDENTVTIRHSRLHSPEVPLDSHNDHRVAMSLAVAALAAGLTVTIQDAQAVNKSWPAFWQAIGSLGAEVEEHA